MPACKIYNNGGAPLPLPFPFRGILGPGQSICVALSVGQVQTSLIGVLGGLIPGLVLTTLPDDYPGPFDPFYTQGGGGSGGGGWNYVLDSIGGTQDPSQNVYTSFHDLMAALDALPEGVNPTVQFLGNFTFPLVGMPPNGWNFRLGTWTSPVLATGSITVTIPEGVKIDSLTGISNGLLVEANPTATTPFNWSYITSIVPSIPRILFVGLGAALRNGGSIPLIEGGGTGTFTVLATQGASFFAVPPSTAPFVHAIAPDAVVDAQTFSGFYGSLPDGWLTGSCIRITQVGVDTRIADLPGATGPIIFNAQSILNPRAQTTAVRTLIYTDAVPGLTQVDRFNDWTKLMATYALLDEPKQVALEQTNQAVPLTIPVGTWEVRRITSFAPFGTNSQLALGTGCVIKNLAFVGPGVAIGVSGATPGLEWDPPAPGSPTILVIDLGSVIGTFPGATSPLIHWDHDGSGGELLFFAIRTGSSIINGGGGPAIDVTPTGPYPSQVVMYMFDGGQLTADTLIGADAAGGTAAVIFVDNGGAQIDLNQPSWTAAALLSDPTRLLVQAQVRIPILTAPTAGPYSSTNGNEFIRYDASGGAVPITILDPRLVPGQTMLLKEVSGVPIGNLVLTSPFGNIDGAASPVVIPTTPFMVTRLTSDGVDWWIT